MTQIVRKASPERREQDLVWGVLFSLRARGVTQLDNTAGRLHTVLGRVFEESESEVREAIGFVPKPNILFGEYRCLTEALDSAQRAGHLGFVNPTSRKVLLNLRAETAQKALHTLILSPELAQSLADKFWSFYKATADLRPTN